MKRLTRTTVRVCTAVVACGGAVGIALTVGVAVGSNQAASPTTTRTALSAAATVPPSDLASSYRFLTAASSTPLPTSLASNLGWASSYGISPSLGRDAGSIGTERLWLVPGSSGSCLELSDGGSVCASNPVAEQRGLWLMLQPVSGAAPTVFGIVPDGATVSGDSASISRSANAVMVTPSSSAPGQFTVHAADGATVSMPVPAATGHPQ